jgi:hypothetical protein
VRTGRSRRGGVFWPAGQRVLDKTGSLKAVQKLLGNESIQTTGGIYTDWDIDQLASGAGDDRYAFGREVDRLRRAADEVAFGERAQRCPSPQPKSAITPGLSVCARSGGSALFAKWQCIRV